MSHDHRPANANEQARAFLPWAAWPDVRSYVAVWSAVSSAGVSSWLSLQQALLETSGEILRRQHLALHEKPAGRDLDTVDPVDVAMDDVRACGQAVMQAQIDALAALRRSI